MLTARYQIRAAGIRPMPLRFDPLQVGLLCGMPLIVFGPEPSDSR